MIAKYAILAVLTATSLLSAPALSAEEAGQTPAIAAGDISQGKIVSFVNAMIAVERVRQDYLPRMEAAKTEAERQVLAREADSAAKAAADGVAGITAQEYLEIAKAAQSDSALAGRIEQRVADLRQKQRRGQPAPKAKAQ